VVGGADFISGERLHRWGVLLYSGLAAGSRYNSGVSSPDLFSEWNIGKGMRILKAGDEKMREG